MEFRPCIDIHNGLVKQIVGSSLQDEGDNASENFVSMKGAAYFASLYKRDGIKGAHVIMLNSKDSDYFEATRKEALSALLTYPGGLQIGGGINAGNAGEYLKAGASHVIVTSFAFSGGFIREDNIRALKDAVGREHVVLDLSAGMHEGAYHIVTDRWQKYAREELNEELLIHLSDSADEFLVHGIDAEGKRKGFDRELVKLLSKIAPKIPGKITYAGGITTMEDVEEIKNLSNGLLNITVGSALDLFGGSLSYSELSKIK